MQPERQRMIRALFDEYIEMYASRDDRLATRFSENFSGCTGSGDFLVKDKSDWVNITRQDFSQVTGRIRFEMLDLSMQDISGLEGTEWKIVHNSYSVPYRKALDGEIFPIKSLHDRNLELEALIDERTAALARSEERWKFALEGANEGVWDWNFQTGDVLYSKRWKEIFGYAESEIGSTKSEWYGRIHPDDLAGVTAIIEQHLFNNAPAPSVEYRMLCKDGTWKWTLGRGMVVSRNGEGKPLRVVGTNTDISDRKRIELELGRLAQTDVLTNLANRRHFMMMAEQELSRTVRYGGELSVLMIDVDHFKNVNDTYGHHIGDLVLKRLGQVCHETLRDIDTVGRVGGEEFAVVLPQTGKVQALEAAQRLRQDIEIAEIKLEHGVPLHVSVSIGATTLVGKEANLDTLLAEADKALYEAKHKGRNRVCVWNN